MLRKILGYGTIAGAVVAIPMCAMTLFPEHVPLAYGALIGYTTMLIALSTVFVAIKRYRDQDRGGVIGFWRALGLGLAISFVASVLYVASWEAVQAATHMDFASDYAAAVIRGQQKKGVSGEALAKVTAEMEQFKIDYANPLFRLPMTFIEIFPVGVLVSLISAGLLRNRRFLAVQRA